MKITKNDLIKLKILILLEKSHDKFSITTISKKLGIKHETARNSIAFLIPCGLLELSTEKHGSLVYEYVQLSNLGRKVATGQEYAQTSTDKCAARNGIIEVFSLIIDATYTKE